MASVEDAIATMARNIEQTTGRAVAEWVALVRGSGLTKHGEMMTLLKGQHGIGHGYANHIAKEALKPDDSDPVELMFAKKPGLKPMYDELVRVALSLGKDTSIAPKKNNVSLRRAKQFGLLQPSTATRLDVGLIIPAAAPTERLEASGSFNAMFTHRVRVTSVRDIDSELTGWLREAYEHAG